MFVLLFSSLDWYLLQFTAFLKPDSKCFNSPILSSVDKVLTGI